MICFFFLKDEDNFKREEEIVNFMTVSLALSTNSTSVLLIWLENETEGIPLVGMASMNFMTVSLALSRNSTSVLLIWLENETAGIPLVGTASINFMTVSLALSTNSTSSL